MNPVVTALLSGTLFGAGLATAQMTNPAKVLDFLDVTGRWDPSLAFVMGSALLVSAIAYRVQTKPLELPTEIDSNLLVGASLFGAGWGLAGYCPGPAIAALATLSPETAVFVSSLVAGMLVHRALDSFRSQSRGSVQGSLHDA